jgi:hypothetical protein
LGFLDVAIGIGIAIRIGIALPELRSPLTISNPDADCDADSDPDSGPNPGATSIRPALPGATLARVPGMIVQRQRIPMAQIHIGGQPSG